MRSSIDIEAMDIIDVRCEVVSIRDGYRYSMLSTIDRRAWERRSDVVIDGSLMEWKYGSMGVRKYVWKVYGKYMESIWKYGI